MAAPLLLTYAVRNADCHAKNLALLYTAGDDVHLSPAYDFLTTTAYASYQYNPPGIGFIGKKTWTTGQTLPRFIASMFGIPLREQALLVEAISDAVSDVVGNPHSEYEKSHPHKLKIMNKIEQFLATLKIPIGELLTEGL